MSLETQPTATNSRCGCGYLRSAKAAFCRRCGRRFDHELRQAARGPVGIVSPLHFGAAGDRSVVPLPRRPALRRARERARVLHRRPSPIRQQPTPPDQLLAKQVIDEGQQRVVAGAVAFLAVTGLINVQGTLVLLVAIVTALYLAALYFRISLFTRSMHAPALLVVSEDAALAVWDRTLPMYTILVPAYHEPEVIGQLLQSIDELDYPQDRLDVKLLLEEDDDETYQAALAARPGPYVEILRVPFSEPRTKPKACNYGLARARGKFVTIYDAEDRPEPLQLRRAVLAFRELDPSVACLQAKLSFHNVHQNLITRWFTIEYSIWFSQLLPGLVQEAAPVPLGGTSNHIRREVLERVGGWDPHNVTEDADLGIRLHRAGYRTLVLDSTTYEEANSDFVNWVKQRSRWYKGYMQTWLVHMRNPRRLYRQLGLRGFVGFNLFLGGTPILALLSPVFWVLTAAWFVARPEIVEAMFPFWVYYAGLFCMVFGNLVFLYISMVSARESGWPNLVFAALLSPMYWAMMSLAAVKALVQLIVAPSFWEKTVHGLDQATDRTGHAVS